MQFKKHYHLMRVSYNGAKYFGWQKQLPDTPTVHQRFDIAFREVFGEEKFKTMASSRTDARVHALGAGVLLITYRELQNLEEFQEKINSNLPDDIRLLSIQEVALKFRIINDVIDKEYLYYFSNDPNLKEDNENFVNFIEKLDIEKMKEACKLIVGEHNFKNFQYKPTENKTFIRTVFECEILENPQVYRNENFPEQVFALRIKGSGFLRNMVRILMGVLFNIGQGIKTLEDLKEALENPEEQVKVGFIAPASGLYLHYITYDEESLKFQ